MLQVPFLLGRIFAACPTQLDDAKVLRFDRSNKVLIETSETSQNVSKLNDILCSKTVTYEVIHSNASLLLNP